MPLATAADALVEEFLVSQKDTTSWDSFSNWLTLVIPEVGELEESPKAQALLSGNRPVAVRNSFALLAPAKEKGDRKSPGPAAVAIEDPPKASQQRMPRVSRKQWRKDKGLSIALCTSRKAGEPCRCEDIGVPPGLVAQRRTTFEEQVKKDRSNAGTCTKSRLRR